MAPSGSTVVSSAPGDEMFIAEERRKTLMLRRSNILSRLEISLLRSFKLEEVARFYKHFVPLGLKRRHVQIRALHSRGMRTVYFLGNL